MESKTMIRMFILFSLLTLIFATGCQPSAQSGRSEDDGQSYYDEDLDEEIPAGEVPKEEAAGTKAEQLPLDKYTYTWTDSEDLPDVVIIVDDFGNSGALLEDYAKLPSEVVFAVLPDLSHTSRAGEIAAQNNHEVLIHLPMQAESSSANPGKQYVKTTSPEEEIAALIKDFQAQLPMAIGANNHMGSAVTADRGAMTSVLKQLDAQGLFFVDSATSGASVSPALARSFGFPALKRDIFLDVPDNSDATLAAKISSLAKYKGRREPVIIITHCHNREKLEALRKFITQIQGMGLKLSTLSRAVKIAA